jgi:hypothetical protein
MTAGWRRGSFPSARRSVRRIVAIAIAVVVFAVIVAEVAADVVNSGHAAERVAAQTYVAEVIPVIDDSTTLASTMHLLRDGVTSLDRTSLEEALGSLVAGTSQNLAQLGALGVSAPTPRSQQLLQATLVERAGAARTLAGAIALAIGPTASSPGSSSPTGGASRGSALPASVVLARANAVTLVVQAGKRFMTGDRDYSAFVRSLPRSSRPERLPSSKWVTDPAAWSKASVTTWVAQLSSTPRLQVHESLVIVAMTVQPPVVRIIGLPTTTTTTSTTTTSTTTTTTIPGRTTSTTTSTSTTTTSTSTTTTTLQLPPPGSTSVLLPTTQVSVVLVVANAGNAEISGIWAVASVVPEPLTGRHRGPGMPTRSTSARIGRLAPGASVVATLPALRVATGGAYTLWASVGTGSLPAGPVTGPPKGVGQTDEVKIKVASG